MKYKIFLLTTGQDVVWETLDSIKKFTKIPHDLHVWYQTINDKKPSLETYNRLLSYTDNVIMSTENFGVSPPFGFGMTYMKYDYLLRLDQDHVLLEGYFDEIMKYFYNFRRVGFVGQGQRDNELKDKFEVNNPLNIPDGGGIFSHEAINDIGSFAGFFPPYGYEIVEWAGRAIIKDWKVIHITGIINNGGTLKQNHIASEALINSKGFLNEAARNQIIADKLGYKHYNWWADRL